MQRANKGSQQTTGSNWQTNIQPKERQCDDDSRPGQRRRRRPPTISAAVGKHNAPTRKKERNNNKKREIGLGERVPTIEYPVHIRKREEILNK